METKNTATNLPDLATLETLALDYVRQNAGCEISGFMQSVFPSPAFVAGDAAWNTRRLRWQDEAYSGNGVEYANCAWRKCALAFIALTKAGQIREHITGFGFSTYSIR